MKYLIANYSVDGITNSSIPELIKYLEQLDKIFIDTETNSNSTKFDVLDQKVVMLQLGDGYNQWAIDVREIDISELYDHLTSKIVKVGHNIKFDYQVIKNCFGIELGNVYDTMLVEQLIINGKKTKKGYYTLENITTKYEVFNPYGNQLSLFDPCTPKSTRTNVGKSGNFTKEEITYGCLDIESAFRCYKHQQKLIEQLKLKKVVDLENNFVLVLDDMELNGMPLDVDRWMELDEWARIKLEAQYDKLHAEFPEVENWGSWKQVNELFKAIGINTTVKDKNKSKETGENVTKESVQ